VPSVGRSRACARRRRIHCMSDIRRGMSRAEHEPSAGAETK
jgi:hypothetical protein